MKKEIYKDIKGYEGEYMVSNRGNVYSCKRNIILKPAIAKGYLRVGLYKDGVRKYFLVHRLVAEAFIPNPKNLPVINHLDEDKTNNDVSNLEWTTSKENTRYSCKGTKSGKIVAILPLGEIKIFKNLISATDWVASEFHTTGNSANICIKRLLDGKSKSNRAYGIIWKKLAEIEDDLNEIKGIIDAKSF